MDAPFQQLIAALHQSPHQCVLALAGGGTAALGMLLNVPGGSRTILEAVVPYGETAFAEFLGQHPDQFCSAATSRLLAGRARDRARWLAPGGQVIGVGCTATLATDRPKRGDHRFFIATSGDDEVTTFALTLEKGARDREQEEAVLDAVLLNALAEACALPERLPLSLRPGEVVDVERSSPGDLVAAVVNGQLSAVCVEPDGKVHATAAERCALLPGAFNPVHHGHWELAAVARRLTGLSVAFELSVTNVDKPTLALAEVRQRLDQFLWRSRVLVTRAPTFREKAALLPGAVFVVGADTALRIVQPRYYQDREDLMIAALEQIRGQGCRFLVAGREDAAGRFVSGADLAVPVAFQDLFAAIPECDFHVPVSSTALREQTKCAGVAPAGSSP